MASGPGSGRNPLVSIMSIGVHDAAFRVTLGSKSIKSEGVFAGHRGSRLWESNPRPTHYEGAAKVRRGLHQHRQHALKPSQHSTTWANAFRVPRPVPRHEGLRR